jgi:hypothetical protein
MAATMVAKLSSTRIISDASLLTSVPVRPMATPMSANLSAGASLTPSPVMATMWLWRSVTTVHTKVSTKKRFVHASAEARYVPALLVGLNDLHLVFGRHSVEHGDVVNLRGELVLGHLLDVVVGKGHAAPVEDVELPGDRDRRLLRITGDHHHLDAASAHFGDRLLGCNRSRGDEK